MISTMSNSFKIKDYVEGTYEITDSPAGLNSEDLFELGIRINPKRSFLFVNKMLGKHLEVHPQLPRLAGMLLAHQYAISKGYFSPFTYERLVSLIRNPHQFSKEDYILLQTIPWYLPKKTLFIGFCETATGLGHATFANFSNATYLHTTRENLSDYMESNFDFKEDHSHATDHFAFAKDPNMFDVDEIVLVDDEVTTGNTALNLIKALSKEYGVRDFTVLSLLDWRSDDHKLETTYNAMYHGVDVHFESLASGSFVMSHESPIASFEYETSPSQELNTKGINPRTFLAPQFDIEQFGETAYANYTGRFGITSASIGPAELFSVELGEELEKSRKTNKKTIVMGHGEFIYIPSRVASYMGDDVTFKSSTRSPILPLQEENYPIQDVARFELEDTSTYFTYNLKHDEVKEVFYLFETPLSNKDCEEIERTFREQGVEVIHFIKCI